MYANRVYKVQGQVGAGLGLSIRMDDEIGPFLSHLVKTAPKIAFRAMRHTAHRVQGDMKAQIASGRGTPEQSVLATDIALQFRRGRRYWTNDKGEKRGIRKALHLPHKLKKGTTRHQMLKKHLRRKHRWMGSSLSKNRYMARAIGYDSKTFQDKVLVGWLSKSAVKWAKKYQKGTRQTVTDDMRNYFHAIGIPISKRKTVIHTKGNPFMANYYSKNRSQMTQIFKNRFILKFNETNRKAKRSRVSA